MPVKRKASAAAAAAVDAEKKVKPSPAVNEKEPVDEAAKISYYEEKLSALKQKRAQDQQLRTFALFTKITSALATGKDLFHVEMAVSREADVGSTIAMWLFKDGWIKMTPHETKDAFHVAWTDSNHAVRMEKTELDETRCVAFAVGAVSAVSFDAGTINRLRLSLVNVPIFVKTLTGVTMTLYVDPLTRTVADLRDEIAEKRNIDGNYNLVYAGKLLMNADVLSVYGIGNESNIHMITQMRGS